MLCCVCLKQLLAVIIHVEVHVKTSCVWKAVCWCRPQLHRFHPLDSVHTELLTLVCLPNVMCALHMLNIP